MTDKKDFFDIQIEIKHDLIAVIKKLHALAQSQEFDDLKDLYKSRIFDYMKKLTQIKDEL